MSYNTRFYAEFIDAPTVNAHVPYTNRYVLARFMLDGYTGPAEEIEVFADSGLRTRKESAANLFEAINSKSVEVKLRTHSPDVARALFATNDRQWRVEILKRSSTSSADYRLDFAGWLTPTYTQFDYKKPPFALNLTAACGLASLKDRPLLDGAGKRLTGYESLSTVIRTALYQTGHDLDLISALNLYELSDMAAGQTVPGANGAQIADPARDPLRRALLNTLSLVDEKNQTVTAYDALKAVLETFPGLRIAQQNGQWVIARAFETPGGYDPSNGSGSSVHGRIYPARSAANTAPTAHQSFEMGVTVYPNQAVRAKTGGSTGLSPQKGGVQIEQKFGQLITLLPNGNLSDVDSTGLPTGWTRRGFTADQAKRIGQGTEAAPYKLRIKGFGNERYSHTQNYIGVSIPLAQNVPAYNKETRYTLKGTYQLYKVRSAQIAVFAKQNGTFTLGDSSGTWTTQPAPKDQNSIRFDNSQGKQGKVYGPNPQDFSITFDAINKVSLLDIRFLVGEDLDRTDGSPNGQQNPDAYWDVWNLSLTTEVEGLVLNGQSVSYARDNRKPEPVTPALTYGDYPADSASGLARTGVLITRASGSPTATWFNPADTALLNGKPLIRHHLQARVNQAMQAVDDWKGKVTGDLPYGMHTVLRFADIGEVNPVHGLLVPWAFVITSLDTDERLLEHNLTAVRIMADLPIGATKAYWQTPDGELLQSPDDSGQAVEPTAPIGSPSLPTLPPDLFDRIRAGLNLPTPQPIAGLIPSGSIGAVLKLDAGTGTPPALGVSLYRPVPDNLTEFIDEPA